MIFSLWLKSGGGQAYWWISSFWYMVVMMTFMWVTMMLLSLQDDIWCFLSRRQVAIGYTASLEAPPLDGQFFQFMAPQFMTNPELLGFFLLSSAFWDFRQIYENSKEFVIFRNNLVLKNSNRFQSFWGHTLADPPFPWDKNFVLFCSRVWCMSTGWGSFPSNETAQIGQPDDSKSHNSL